MFANGDSYVGQYKLGKPDGNGHYKWQNGSTYVGEFKNGLKHGKGKWKKSKGASTNTYDGEYVMDKKNGYGVFSWASGNLYKGNYKDDERHGYGEMFWTDGSVYKGDWIHGIQHGFGQMVFPDGSVKEGFFDNNVFKGQMTREEAQQYKELSPVHLPKIAAYPGGREDYSRAGEKPTQFATGGDGPSERGIRASSGQRAAQNNSHSVVERDAARDTSFLPALKNARSASKSSISSERRGSAFRDLRSGKKMSQKALMMLENKKKK